jgi:16S rRNA (guanine966-N2)-methyltransferase
MLRLIAGRFRGRRLATVPGTTVRPTADAMRETVFNVLQAEVADAAVLDLYAGTGALGLEALSRGARRVVLVERDRRALLALRRNVAALGVQAGVEVVAADALGYLGGPHPEPFDLVLADPPYAVAAEAAVLAGAAPALRPGGVLVLQHPRRFAAPPDPAGFRTWRSKRFGDTVIDFFVREEG